MYFSDFIKHKLVDNSSYTFHDDESPIVVYRFGKKLDDVIFKPGSYVGPQKKK